MKKHNYEIKVEWTGNEGKGTLNYKSYNRNHTIIADGKYSVINGSSDPSFLGDKTRYNPEDLFLSSLSACHAAPDQEQPSGRRLCVASEKHLSM